MIPKECFIDSPWEFRFNTTKLIEELNGTTRPDLILEFKNRTKFFEYLATTPFEEQPRGIHDNVDKLLLNGTAVKFFNKKRSNLTGLKYFRKYRGYDHSKFHLAALAADLNLKPIRKNNIILGLDLEIQSSKILLPKGFVVFHGCENEILSREEICSTYISTTLHPIVAMNSAIRRCGSDPKVNNRTVYILTFKNETLALWGHTRRSAEFELLLPRKLRVSKSQIYHGLNFDIIHADIT
jgi:hypothetical protein